MGDFKAGYKFKETHIDIHYVKIGHGKPGDRYSSNFTTDSGEAKGFDSLEEAQVCVFDLMDNFERDEDYRWTPVICSPDGSMTQIFSSRWH